MKKMIAIIAIIIATILISATIQGFNVKQEFKMQELKEIQKESKDGQQNTVFLMDFGGLETGGFEEIKSQSAQNQNQIVTTPKPFTSKEKYSAQVKGFFSVGKIQGYIETESFSTDTNWITFGWYWYSPSFNAQGSTGDPAVFQARDATGSTAHWKIEHFLNGDLNLVDATGTHIATISNDPVPNNKWARYEVKWKRSDTGDMRFYINGQIKLDLIGQDFNATNDNVAMRFEHADGTDTGLEPTPNYIGSWYYHLDNGANIDTDDSILGVYTVLGPYQDQNNGATGDFGDALNVGTWANVGQTPVNNTDDARYTVNALREGGITTHDGNRSGPKGDKRLAAGNIKGAQWIWKWKKSGDAFPRGAKLKYGATTVVTTDNTTQTVVLVPPTSFEIRRIILKETNTNVPTKDEWFQIGFQARSLSDFFTVSIIMAEQWAFLLVQEPRCINLNGFVKCIAKT